MMNGMKRLLYIASLALALASCDKINESLTRLPIDDVNPDAFFTSESECQLWLNRCYANYLTVPESSCQWCSDDCVSNNMSSWMLGTRLATSANTGESYWGWDTMRRINLFLEHSSNCKDEAVRLHYEAEARFFRAYGYFLKVKHFGDVPFYDHVVSSTDMEDLCRPRDPRGYVMLQIMKDLDFAIEHLPEKKDVARVTKWTALAMKSRAALFEGTWRVYHDDDCFAPANDPSEFDGKPVQLSAKYFLELAAEAAGQVIDGGKYDIWSKGSQPYRSLFNADNAIDEEVILAKIYNNTTSELKNFAHSLPYNYDQYNLSVPRKIINMYLCKDGSRFTDKPGNEKMWFLDEVADRDPRLSETFMCPGYRMVDAKSLTPNTFYKTYTGYKPIKFAAKEENSIMNKGVCDMPVFRYAEVLLNYAEAKAELGTLTQDDLDKSVNLLRGRVGMPKLLMGVSSDPYMEKCYPNSVKTAGNRALVLEVRRERILELIFEGFHRYDVLRWREGLQQNSDSFSLCGPESCGYYGVYIPGPGIFDMDGDGVKDFEIYLENKTSGPEIPATNARKIADLSLVDPDDPWNPNPQKGYMTAYRNDPACKQWKETRDYLYPIPQAQIDLTNESLTQNPGW